MDATTRKLGTRSARLFRVAVPVVVLVVSGLVASTANAYSLTSKGSPGSASTPKAIVSGPRHWTDSNGILHIDMNDGYFTQPGRTVWESPKYPSSWQKVCVSYRFYGYEQAVYSYFPLTYVDRWTLVAWLNKCGWISPSNTSVKFSGAEYAVPDMPYYNGYAVGARVTWQLQDGTLIGNKFYDYDNWEDYSCQVTCLGGTTGAGDAYLLPSA